MQDGFYSLCIHETEKHKAVMAMLNVIRASEDFRNTEFIRFKLHLILYLTNQLKDGSYTLKEYDVNTQIEIQNMITNVGFNMSCIIYKPHVDHEHVTCA